LLLDDRTDQDGDLQVQSIAHGVVALEKLPLDYGVERRRLKVVKMRGLKFRGGYHDFIIQHGGLQVFPRLVAAEHHTPFERGSVSSDLPALDALLGGGLDRGTSNLFMGPAGAGKSTLAMQYAVAMAGKGEPVVLYSFDEALGTIIARAGEIGMDLQGHINAKKIGMHQIDPAELPPGQFSDARVAQFSGPARGGHHSYHGPARTDGLDDRAGGSKLPGGYRGAAALL
jgi:circadian clock protein KaiC